MFDGIPANIRAVFFDAVGTLLFPDPDAIDVYAAVARRFGADVSGEEVRARFVAAFQAEEEADRIAGWVTNQAREVERWRQIVSASIPGAGGGFEVLYDHFAAPTSWRLNPDTAEVLTALRACGIRVGLATNYDARIWPVVDGFPVLQELRELLVVSSEVGHRKPSTRFFDELVRRSGASPDRIIVVGDDLGNDYHGARAAGLHAILLDESDRHPAIPHRVRTLRALVA